MELDEILELSKKIGIKIESSSDGKHYILDETGTKVEFSTSLLITALADTPQ